MITDRVPCRKFYNGGAFIDKIYDNCCGIDVHKKLIVSCFRKGNKQEIREFGATTRELLEMVDWLKSGGCEMAAMESTASYWKPLYNILESSDLNAMVVNARHMKAVPSRLASIPEPITLDPITDIPDNGQRSSPPDHNSILVMEGRI